MKKSVTTRYGKVSLFVEGEPPAGEGKRIFLTSGFGESANHTKDLRDILSGDGHVTYATGHPRGGNKDNPLSRDADVIEDTLDGVQMDGEKIWAVAHSLGTVGAMAAVRNSPERFAGVVLLQPLGMDDSNSVVGLAARVAKKVAKNQIGATRAQVPGKIETPKGEYRAQVDAESAQRRFGRMAMAQLVGGAVLMKNLLNSVRTARAAANYSLEEDLVALDEMGVPVNIVKSHSDELFGTAEVDQFYEDYLKENRNSIHSLSSVADPRARHDTSWEQARRTANIINVAVGGEVDRDGRLP